MAQDYAKKNGKSASPPKVIPMWRPNTKGLSAVSWSECDPGTIRGTIDAVTRGGGAIMFGRTSDGGALSLCILQDSEKIKEYPHTATEATELLESITQHYANDFL
jgi:hypothetical protein